MALFRKSDIMFVAGHLPKEIDFDMKILCRILIEKCLQNKT